MQTEGDEMEKRDACGRPCSQESPCDECEEYWHPPIPGGVWDMKRMRWIVTGREE